MFALPGCQPMSVNALLCDIWGWLSCPDACESDRDLGHRGNLRVGSLLRRTVVSEAGYGSKDLSRWT